MVNIKEVISISLGSSSRDHSVVLNVLGEEFRVSRIGCNGDRDLMKKKLIEADLNPNVRAIGIGGADIFLNAAGKRYYFREIKSLVRAVHNTPVVDGSGLKGAVEASTVAYMVDVLGIEVAGKKTLVTSAIDRWGIAMAFADAGADVIYGDLLYALDIPIIIHSKKALERAIKVLLPLASQMPFSWIYPSESDSSTASKRSKKTDELYYNSDIIVGDYKFVIKFMPDDVGDKIIVTNTTTTDDLALLQSRGIKTVITTTPRLEGRTFGTNVMEALLVALTDSSDALESEQYLDLLKRADFLPAIYRFE